MIKIKNYKKVENLEEAWELNQKRTNRIIGGMLWVKMSDANVQTAIDLSGLGLDQIEETEEEFRIGCMVTLRQMELHEGLSHYTEGAVKDAFRHIVGVQFRNLATVGGSLFGRFGFSDVLTLLLALDCDVELYKGGIMSIQEFAKLKRDNDILVHIIIKKTPVHICYQSVRNTVTDFPTLNMTAAIFADKMRISIGARPGKAMLFEDAAGLLKGLTNGSVTEEVMHTFAKEIKEKLPTGSNMRGTAEYRSHLAEVMTVRALVYWEVIEMQISIVLNGKKIQEEIEPDLLLIDFVRKHGCKSVKTWM